MKDVVIGIDPGNKSAIAILDIDNFDLVNILKIKFKEINYHTVSNFINSVDLSSYNVLGVAIETQYLGKNIKSFGTLVRTRVLFEAYFSVNFPEVPIYYVSPSEWGKVLGVSRYKSKERKKVINEFFSSKFNRDLTEDQSDACAISYWLLDKLNKGGLF